MVAAAGAPAAAAAAAADLDVAPDADGAREVGVQAAAGTSRAGVRNAKKEETRLADCPLNE